jgi:hypothetical protein
MAPTLPRIHPLIALHCLRASYRAALSVREMEARARLAETQRRVLVSSIAAAVRASDRARMAAAP